jgi:hypothetical protein
LAKQEKVSGCRAAPGYYVRRNECTGPPKRKQKQTQLAASHPARSSEEKH